MAAVLGPTTIFWKIPRSNSGSVARMGNSKEKGPPTLRTNQSQPYNDQNGRFCPPRGVFQKYLIGHCDTERLRGFLLGIPRLRCRTRAGWSIFQKSSMGPSTVAIRLGRWRPDRQKMGNAQVKMRHFSISQKNTHFDPKFDGDSNSAIKHDIVLWFDQVLGVQHWLKTRWGPKHTE